MSFKVGLQRLRKLSENEKSDLVVEEFPDSSIHYYGVQRGKAVVVLFHSTGINNPYKNTFFPRYEHLRVSVLRELDIKKPGQSLITGRYSVIEFTVDSKDLEVYFLQLCSEICRKLGESPTLEEVLTELKSVFSLFKLAATKPKKDVQGLWAELLLILDSPNTAAAVNSWHTDSNDPFDFVTPNCAIEVKSTTNQERSHRFSNHQLQPITKDRIVFIASVKMLKTDLGKSVIDLVDDISLNLSFDLQFKLRKIVHQILGSEIGATALYRYDINYALSEIKLFEASKLPSFSSSQIPKEMSEIRFRLNLEGFQESLKSDLWSKCGLEKLIE